MEDEEISIVINNAAQTVRRPPAYYSNLVDKEVNISPTFLAGGKKIYQDAITPFSMNENSSLSTQLPLIPSDFDEDRKSELFPNDQTDEFGEPVDKRSKTSWNSSLDDIHYLEVIETQLVNVVAPFIIIQAFSRSTSRYNHGIVINVTSPEGQFNLGYEKLSVHPHTNMAKASLNMMTLSLASCLLSSQAVIFSVDPGWVSDTRPFNSAPISVPLTVEDGAARVLHPIFELFQYQQRLLTEFNLKTGTLLRNFKETPW